MKPRVIQFEVSDESQEALLRQFYAYVQEMNKLALSAPPGQVIDACEQMAWQRGQDINREVLQKAVDCTPFASMLRAVPPRRMIRATICSASWMSLSPTSSKASRTVRLLRFCNPFSLGNAPDLLVRQAVLHQ